MYALIFLPYSKCSLTILYINFKLGIIITVLLNKSNVKFITMIYLITFDVFMTPF